VGTRHFWLLRAQVALSVVLAKHCWQLVLGQPAKAYPNLGLAAAVGVLAAAEAEFQAPPPAAGSFAALSLSLVEDGQGKAEERPHMGRDSSVDQVPAVAAPEKLEP